jgi:hypothetical protein
MSSARILADLFESPASHQLRSQYRALKAQSKTVVNAPSEFDLVTEAVRRPGLLGIGGKAVKARATKDLRSYFRSLKSEVKKLKLQQLASSDATMTAETAKHAATMRLQNTVRHARPVLQALLESNMVAAMLVADKISEHAEATQPTTGDVPLIPPDLLDIGTEIEDEIDRLGLSGQAAAAWAAKNAGQLIPGIDDYTIQLIADAVSEGIQEQLGVSGTAQLINQILDDMTSTRAATIATTEMNAAMSEAALQKLTRLGIAYKQWILGPNPCEICQDNEDAGAIEVDEDFPSGDARPPAHPNCECAVTGARAPEDEAA